MSPMTDDDIFDRYVGDGADWLEIHETPIYVVADMIQDINPDLDDYSATKYAEAIKRVLAKHFGE